MTLDKPENLEKKQEPASNQPDLKDQVVEEPAEKSEQDFYTKNITRIEGGNLRGGAPGRVNGERTVESTEKAVKTIHEKFHPNTVISFENTEDDSANTEILTAEKKAWTELGVKFIELPVKETEFNKLFEEELKPKTLEAFAALDNGGTFVHCTHGLQRARAFTEIWRATRGIDRRKAIQENPNLNNENKSEGHRKCGNDVQEIIKRILENPLEARKELSKEVAPTPETLTDETLAPRLALIGDSIGEGISSAIAAKFPGHETHAVSGARITEGQKHKSISAQLDEIDPQKTPYLIIQGGTNEIGHSDPIAIAEKIKNLYERALSKGFKKVVVVTLTPHKNQAYTAAVDSINAQLRIFAQKGEINLYDLNTEYLRIDPEAKNLNKKGVHFTNKGYELLAEILLKGIKEKLSEESKEKLAEAIGKELEKEEQLAPETIQTPQSTEHLSEKSKELQKKLEKEIEAITEEQRKQDEQKLSQAEIKDIRFNTALLNGDEDKVKEEMTHRLAQYTEKIEDGGLRLNYAKFNLSGRDHEMNIGLGDIMPPEYKKIAVVTSGGSVRIGTRRLVSTSKESNRVGYVDEATGGYLATFTGDKIYVLDPPITDEKELAELLAKEKEARKNGSQNFNEYTNNYEPTENYSGYSGYSPSPESGSTETANIPEGPLTQEIVSAAAAECSNHEMTMEQAVLKQNLMKIIDYVAHEIDIPPYILFAVLAKECSFRFYPPVTNLGGAVVGMAQHKISGWEDAKKRPIFQKVMSKFVQNPLTMKRAENILADILSAAIRLRNGVDYFGYDINYSTDLTKDTPDKRGMTRVEWLRVLYKRPGDAHAITRPEKFSPERRSRAAKSFREDRDAFTRYLNYTKRAKSIMDHAYREQPKAYAEQQPPRQPSQATELTTGLTRDEQILAQRVRSMPKPNFDYDAVYVLGCRAEFQNKRRAIIGAELALKNNAAFLTSGGITNKSKGISEGKEAFDYIANNPYYITEFKKAGIKTGIEDQSKDTTENAENAAAFFRSKGFKRVLIVTTESGRGTYATHGTKGTRNLKRTLKGTGIEVAFYTPERPNIDRNLA